jgi:hypothetical protein
MLVPVDVANAPDWLISLGLNPSWEALGTQLAIAVTAVAGIALAARRRSAAKDPSLATG